MARGRRLGQEGLGGGGGWARRDRPWGRGKGPRAGEKGPGVGGKGPWARRDGPWVRKEGRIAKASSYGWRGRPFQVLFYFLFF